VKKHNRKLLAALCVLIVFKCTEAYGGFENYQERFLKLNQDFKTILGINTSHHHHHH
jgi:hypothetical protein